MNRENIIVELLIRDNYLKLKNGEIEKEHLILEEYDKRKTDDLPDLREDDSSYRMSLIGGYIRQIRLIIKEINNDLEKDEDTVIDEGDDVFKGEEGKKRRRKTKKKKSRRHQKRKSRRQRKRKSRRHKKSRNH